MGGILKVCSYRASKGTGRNVDTGANIRARKSSAGRADDGLQVPCRDSTYPDCPLFCRFGGACTANSSTRNLGQVISRSSPHRRCFCATWSLPAQSAPTFCPDARSVR
jgi:hypothetical protein